MDINEKAKKIKLLLLDVDGVLTDGKITYGNYGDELKTFDIYDGFGLVLLGQTPIECAILTAKNSKIVARRARILNIKHVYQNAVDKLDVYNGILKKFSLNDDDVSFIADEIIDIPVLKRVGLAVSVPNAPQEVRQTAHYVTKKSGGDGAVREVVEIILKSQGLWEGLLRKYVE